MKNGFKIRLAVTRLVSTVFCLCLALGFGARADRLPAAEVAKIDFEQKVNKSISLDLQFTDEAGQRVKLGNYFGRKPVIIVPGYYECPMLCTLVLNGFVEALQDLKSTAGNEFEIVCFSIDPSETPSLAATKKQTYLKRYSRPGAGGGWHFLTGAEPEIKRLAAQLGFAYAYDSASKQFAHPSGFVVLTPRGKIARYFFGVTYSPTELRNSLMDAASEKSASPIQQFLLLCFHYSPITGKYGPLIMQVVRVSGVVTLLALVLLIVRWKAGGSRVEGSSASCPSTLAAPGPPKL